MPRVSIVAAQIEGSAKGAGCSQLDTRNNLGFGDTTSVRCLTSSAVRFGRADGHRRGMPLLCLSSASADFGRTYAVAARRSWKIRRSKLQARLARVSLASARAMPMVRMNPKRRWDCQEFRVWAGG
jgi:hypothetical protein